MAVTPSPTPPVDFPPEPWRAATLPPEPAPGDLEFPCPRCGRDATAETYGPCPTCRDQMRAAMAGEARDVVEEDYVPKMNVTPNAVALKD
ncbi:MAG: hypothetical protein GXY13_11760 [Acidimicrobiales bacterium]|nr:hypothetical protein [Acidimicrobiales bacterium]